MDALSWVLALVVSVVGALVLVYCSSYFGRDEPGLGRFAGVLTAFAGSMYGLVIADDVIVLFVLWEATTVFSYLLIGHDSVKRASRAAAMQALVVTTAGGLAMLAGLVLLSVTAGTTSLSAIVADPPRARSCRCPWCSSCSARCRSPRSSPSTSGSPPRWRPRRR
ncbi:proton-conducting transporter membrane subunit [Curtobacterium flaccumfaciens]|nr:proton-conducting transporter membrane subunit [Curtobacterium flaccumfaciens]